MIRNKIIILLFGLSVLLLIASAIIGALGFPQGEMGPMILRFDPSDEQVDVLGSCGTFFGIFGIAVFIFIINFSLAFVVYDRERFLSYVLAAGTFVVSLIFVMAASIITLAN